MDEISTIEADSKVFLGISPLRTAWGISLRSAIFISWIIDLVIGSLGFTSLILYCLDQTEIRLLGAINGLVELIGAGVAGIALKGTISLQWSRIGIYIKWKYAECLCVLIIFALFLLSSYFPWWVLSLVVFLREGCHFLQILISWSFQQRI
jgi:hypothetical protein